MQAQSAARVARFGSFEVDLRERRLTKMGTRVRLQDQPFRILVLLLERAGELVTREEIRNELWPKDVFVDFDAALNTAMRKLREALCDTADNPRFLETVAGKGYRFVAPVGWPQEPQSQQIVPARSISRLVRRLWLAVIPIVAGFAFLAYRHLHTPAPHIGVDDTIVLADFANSTGDPVFDDTLKTALRLSLRQSPYFKVLPDSDVARTLRQMTLPADTKLTAEQTRELCQRARSKAYLAGSIGSLGTKFVLELKAVNCANGDMLAEEQVLAPSKERIVDAVGEMAFRARRELGESLASLQKFDVPLANATTSSLEALKTLSVGLKVFTEKGPGTSLPYFQRVVDLDPNFALGYRSMGLSYTGLGETDRAREYYSKAFQLREHLTEWEKLAITADYYLNVTGELDKAAETYEQWIASYPRNDGAYSTLGIVYAMQGQYQRASEITKQAIHLAPSYGSYVNLAYYELATQHFNEARLVTADAQASRMDGAQIHSLLYGLAFLGSDTASMAEQVHWFAGKTEETFGIALAGDTEAYRGRLGKAQELTNQAVASAMRTDNKESGAVWLANAAVEEAAYGIPAKARSTAAKALQLAPASPGVQAEAALAFAMAGDPKQAESLAESLHTRFPVDVQMQTMWLPAIQSELALDRKIASNLSATPAVSSIELGAIMWDTNVSCLYSIYVRGEAFLAAGQGSFAAAEFQKILDHSGIVWNCWTGALAHLGVARANALQAKNSTGADADAARVRALAAYKDFLTLWKDADPEIPILRQAKAEYVKLQ